MKTLLNAKQVQSALERLYQAAVGDLPAHDPVAIVGIRTRGQTLAERILQRLQTEFPDRTFLQGVLDITLYRDDLTGRGGAHVVEPTEIGFDLNDAYILLIDDVLATGRSVRAALDALHDFGRPRVVRLGVLVDRGGRQMPIAADFVGKRFRVPASSRVHVQLKETDGQEGVFITQGE